MNVTCAYYTNDKRLALVLGKLALQSDVVVYPVKGTYAYTNSWIRCLGSVLEFLVIYKSGASAVLLTTNEQYAKLDKTAVNYTAGVDNIYSQALSLCLDKARTSGNSFTMECVVDGCTVVAAAEEGDITYTVRAPTGTGIINTESIPDLVQTACKSIRKFKYRVVTETCDKEVSVSRGQVDVFREIAHYINKALLFTKVVDGKPVRQYCITATGCCDSVIKNGESGRISKLPFTKATVDTSCSLSAVEIPLDALLKSEYIMQSLAGGKCRA